MSRASFLMVSFPGCFRIGFFTWWVFCFVFCSSRYSSKEYTWFFQGLLIGFVAVNTAQSVSEQLAVDTSVQTKLLRENN